MVKKISELRFFQPDEFTEKLTTQNQADSNTSMLITTTTSVSFLMYHSF